MLYFPATQRNREPIWQVLGPLIPRPATILEVASGSGEHLAYFQERRPDVFWIPSDPNPDHRASVAAWTGLRALDYAVGSPPPALEVEGMLAINLIHIAPWEVTEALMQAAAQLLKPGGFLFLYGAYRRQGLSTAPSNVSFDESLRAQDPRWGVRDLEAVGAVAASAGLTLGAVVEMPANNLSVIFRQPLG